MVFRNDVWGIGKWQGLASEFWLIVNLNLNAIHQDRG